VDLDDLIVARAGKSIPEIFSQDGEPAFRALEAALCRELAEPGGLVIAVGGGAVVNPANREALAAGGTLICLDASPAALLRRIGDDDNRPMLAGGDRLARIRELLAQRAPAYAAIPNHVDTTQLSIAAAAERVMGVATGLPAGGHRLVVRLTDGDAYDVLIADGLLAQAGQRLLAAGLKPGRCALITNPTVAGSHEPILSRALADAGFEPLVFEIPDGEAHKTLDTAAGLFDRLAAAKLARGEPVIALGGGVVGDLAGFVAATWLRGVPFVQIPASLLAMVDASVGGKVAVDLPAGKNLVGAFKQPEVVLIDPALLSTLPGGEFRSGLAEILKAGIIADPALFEQLATSGPASLTAMIADAVRVKAHIVARDPFEFGDRAWLNLGHTFGHALELLSGYTLRHGEAVALGLIAAGELSAALGHCDAALPARIRAALIRLGLPTRHTFDPAAALAAMGTDKKRRGRSLRFVLIRGIGEVTVADDVPPGAVLEALEMIRE
jgi:3-dehydroquinate synthase